MPSSRTLKLVLEYDGTEFHGWARQPGERTVEGELRLVLERLYESVDELAVAGRTDAGVHALANVVSVVVAGGPPLERAATALNAALPQDVAVVSAEVAPDGFHARFSAQARSYRYRVWRGGRRSPFEARRSLWHPLRRTYKMALTTSRLAVVRGRPPGVTVGMSGAKTVHAVSVRSVGSRCDIRCLHLRDQEGRHPQRLQQVQRAVTGAGPEGVLEEDGHGHYACKPAPAPLL